MKNTVNVQQTGKAEETRLFRVLLTILLFLVFLTTVCGALAMLGYISPLLESVFGATNVVSYFLKNNANTLLVTTVAAFAVSFLLKKILLKLRQSSSPTPENS